MHFKKLWQALAISLLVSCSSKTKDPRDVDRERDRAIRNAVNAAEFRQVPIIRCESRICAVALLERSFECAPGGVICRQYRIALGTRNEVGTLTTADALKKYKKSFDRGFIY